MPPVDKGRVFETGGGAMRILKIIATLIITVLVGVLMLASTPIAKQEYTKKEKKACTYCHTSKNPKDYSDKDLNEAGKYYKEKKTLQGYREKR
jgi:cytochrome c553